MELLIDKLDALKSADAHRDELVRQLAKFPGLKSGEVSRLAKILVDRSSADWEVASAYAWLQPLICLETSYITSAGPLGKTREKIDILDDVEEPFRGITPILALAFILLGIIVHRYIPVSDNFWGAFITFSVVVTFSVMFARQISFNKWDALNDLKKSILRDSKRLDSIIEGVSRTVV